jgi:hypothetical protein
MNFETLSRLYRETITGPQHAKNHYLLQYSLLVDNSPLGPECPYATRARNLHYKEQSNDVLVHLRALRQTIDTLVEGLETLESPDIMASQLELPFVV